MPSGMYFDNFMASLADLVRLSCSVTSARTVADVARFATFSSWSATLRMAMLSKVLGSELETPKARKLAVIGPMIKSRGSSATVRAMSSRLIFSSAATVFEE